MLWSTATQCGITKFSVLFRGHLNIFFEYKTRLCPLQKDLCRPIVSAIVLRWVLVLCASPECPKRRTFYLKSVNVWQWVTSISVSISYVNLGLNHKQRWAIWLPLRRIYCTFLDDFYFSISCVQFMDWSNSHILCGLYFVIKRRVWTVLGGLWVLTPRSFRIIPDLKSLEPLWRCEG